LDPPKQWATTDLDETCDYLRRSSPWIRANCLRNHLLLFLIEFLKIVIFKIVFLFLKIGVLEIELLEIENLKIVFWKVTSWKSKLKKNNECSKLMFLKNRNFENRFLGLLTAEPNWQPGVLLDRESLWSNDHHTHLHEITASCKSCSIESQRRHRPLTPPLHRRHQCPSQ
jgi:hypothetical protein